MSTSASFTHIIVWARNHVARLFVVIALEIRMTNDPQSRFLTFQVR